MNLTIKLRQELTIAVLRDQFGDLIESKEKEIALAVNEKCKIDDGGASEKIINIADSCGLINRLGLTSCVYIEGVNRVVFNGFSDRSFEYSISETFSLDSRYVSRYTFYTPANNEIKSLFRELAAIRKQWNETKDDLFSVLQSVKTVKKLRELTHVFDPFIPKKVSGTELIPSEQLLRINELKTPKNT